MSLFDGWFVRKANPDAERNHLNKILQNIKEQLLAAIAGGVNTVQAGNGIDVDSTDTNNPVVSVEATVLAGASDGATAVQPGDNVSVLVNDAGYTTNTGTVTSVAVANATGISWTGSPITTSGTLTPSLSANLQSWSGIAPASKLDASVYTAADVLAKLITVDGAGSGLDSDLLDGQSSAFYRNAGNLNAGTLLDARVAESNVTQHEAALSIDWSQLASVPATFTPSAHTHAAADVVSGTFVDARIPNLAASKITSGTFADARISQSSVTQHQAALSIGWGQLTGSPPSLLVTDVYTVASQAAQLALVAEEGDIAIRTDLNKSFAHNGGTAGTMADWSELLTPTDAVLSFNGRTGAITLTSGDVTTALGYTPLNTASYTAADVLSKLLTVDGVGSGIDADLLDGQSSAYYRDAGNINAGTLAVARGGTGIASYTTGNYINASGATTLQQRTPAQVLSDIGALASSSYTAADVLSKLLTVDGAGSGLDADLLDGQQGSYYTNIPARLGYTPVNLAGDTMTGDLLVSKSNAVVGVGVSGTLNGGIANYAAAGTGDIGLYSEHAAGRIRLRPNGRLDSTGELRVETGLFTYDGNAVWHAGNLLNIGTTAGSARTALALGTMATEAAADYATAASAWQRGLTGPRVPTSGAADLNDSVGFHAFYASGGSNRPPVGNGLVWGLSVTITNEYGVQEYGRNNQRWFRTRENGAWQTWYQYWHSGNFTPGDYLTTASAATTYAPLSRTLTAGNGLTGGGTLAADRTFTLGTPSTLTASTTNAVTTTSHTHAITGFAALGAANTFTASQTVNVASSLGDWIIEVAGVTAGGLAADTSTPRVILYGSTGSTIFIRPDGRGSTAGQAMLTSAGLFTAPSFAGNGSDITALTAANITASTTVGRNLLNLTNPSAISFLRVNADNTVTAQTASAFRTSLSLGTAATVNTGTSGATIPLLNGNNTFSGTATFSNAAGIDASAGPVQDQYGNVRAMVRTTGALTAGHVFATAAGFTINTGFAAGNVYGVYNDSASAITLTQGAGLTLRLSGTATTGNRTLAARGFATFWCNSTTEYIISGDVT